MLRRLAEDSRGIGAWDPAGGRPAVGSAALAKAALHLAQPLHVVAWEGQPAVALGGAARLGSPPAAGELPLLGHVPPLLPSQLGDPAFLRAHGVQVAYVAGEMANGIASVEMVEAMARAGMLAFFGAAGLSLERIEAAIDRLQALDPLPWGINLIHSPDDPGLEAATVELFLRRGVRLVSASAFMDLTLPVVRYRVAGIGLAPDGSPVAPNRLIAKVSRTEVAEKFLSPPPEAFLRQLVEEGSLTEEQARWAERLPMAEDVTAEADSGGHTDNRPLVVVLPAIQALRDRLHERHGYAHRPRIGAAGGIATPAATAAAFSMGAAYVMTGSVNQACREAGTSDLVRQMLAQARSTDVAMAAAADMFELGVKLQVLSKGSLFAVRANKLYELYRSHDSLEALPPAVRQELETRYFRSTLEEAWEGCKAFFAERDPAQIERAERDPKHRMALVFRSYLGRSSIWANEGVADRAIDFQIWCGPAMGAFNDWARGSFLEDWRARRVVPIARNLLAGAAYLSRLAALRAQGLEIPAEVERFAPRSEAELDAMLLPPPEPPAAARGGGRVRTKAPEPAPAAAGGGTAASPAEKEPLAIVGLGALFPKAQDLRSFWRLVLHGEDAVGEIPGTHFSLADYHDPDPAARDKTYATRGAFLEPFPFDPTEFGIPPSVLEATDTSQLLALAVAKLALEDAGYGEGVEWDRSRCSVLLGVTGTQELTVSLASRLGHPHWRRALREAGVDEATAEEVVERISRSWVEWQENSFPGLLGNVVAGRIANRLNLGGTNAVVDAACASSLGALHMACMELWTGKSDLVISGGVDTLSDIFMHMCFSKTPALSPSGEARPFAADGDGIVLGEGVGMVVLKRLSDAERDGDRIYALIRSVGTSSDGRAKSIYAPLPAGQARALREAYREAGVNPRTIELVEAHGTGTAAGDEAELTALSEVFREAGGAGRWCALGSIKSQVGHTKAAAGAAGLLKAVLALHRKVFPPTLKVETPHPKLAESPFYLSTKARPWLASGAHPRRAAVSAFGFGGSNFHVVLEEAQRQRVEPAWDGSVEIAAGCAADRAGLERWLDAFAAAEDPAAFAARSRGAFRSDAAHRLLLVFDAREPREALLRRARERLARGVGSEKGIHYGIGPAPGKLAFLFPGQGSQSVGMLAGLANLFPEMLEALEEAGAGIAALVHPPPTFDPAERESQRRALIRTENAQPALGAVERGALGVLRRFGVEAELFAGHSYGELVALHAAGRIDAPTLRRLSELRGQAMAGAGKGSMLAVHAPLEEIEALLREEALDLVLANRNAPRQGVLSGADAAIERAVEACGRRGLAASRLPVGAAFHSPLVADAEAALRAGLEALEIAAEGLPVVANSTAAPYPADPAEAKVLLAGQLARPVRFVEVVERLWTEGARTFVEVGPRAVLSGLVRQILGDRPHRALALDKGAIGDLAELLAALAAAGHRVHLEPWQRSLPPPRHRPVERQRRMTIPLTGANYRDPARTPALPPRRPSPAVPAESTMSVKQPLIDPQWLAEALRAQTESLRALQALQEQTIAAHQRFLEGQAAAQANFHALLAGQMGLAEAGQLPLPAAPAPAAGAALPGPLLPTPPAPQCPLPAPAAALAPPPLPSVASATAQVPPARPPAPASAAAEGQGLPPPPAPTGTASASAASPERGPTLPPAAPASAQPVDVVHTLLEVVAESTGYPKEMLELDMDLESDLGIDSIKRVEILSLLSKRIPNAPRIAAERVAELRTLRQVAEAMERGMGHGPAAPSLAPEAARLPGAGGPPSESTLGSSQGTGPQASPLPASPVPVPAPAEGPDRDPAKAAGEGSDPASVLQEVVAELTGYPVEMLELDMDLESDLGIDSIKRVEILSLLGRRLPNLPRLEAERLSELRTLRQIVEAVAPGYGPSAQGREAPPPAEEHAAPAPGPQQSPGAPAPAEGLDRAPTEGRPEAPLEALEVVAVPAPTADAAAPLPPGVIWIIEDDRGLAPALAAALEARGFATRLIPLAPAAEAGDEAIAGLLILGRSDEALSARAFACLRSLAPRLRDAGALVASVSFRDGAFGRVEPALGWEQGGLAGLVKSAAREWPEVRVRAIDCSARLALEEAAGRIADELALAGPQEVGLGPLGRLGLGFRPLPAAEAEAPSLAEGELVVVTGGARGITALCVEELARRVKPSFLLLGRSPAPGPEPAWLAGAADEAAIKRAILENASPEQRPTPREVGEACRRILAEREIRRTLAALEAAGARALYRAVDTRDPAALSEALEEARARFGPIRGLVHGAGVLRDRRIEDKSDEDFAAVFDTKVQGLRNLLAACEADELRFLALFTSVSGRFGRRGQADYAMANETLTAIALAEAARRPACRVLAFDWGPWSGGMVTPALAREFEREGIALIAPAAGARHFAEQVLQPPGGAVEQVVGSGWPLEAPPAADWSLVRHLRLDLESHPYLDDHRLAGKAVLPVVMMVEAFAQAGGRRRGLPPAVEDFRLLKGVVVEGAPVDLGVWLGPEGPAGRAVELRGADGRPHASARLRFPAPVEALPAPAASGPLRPWPEPPARVYESGDLFHGPAFHAIASIEGVGENGVSLILRTSPTQRAWLPAGPDAPFAADPLLLDGIFQGMVLWCRAHRGTPSLPTRLGAWRLLAERLPEQVKAVIAVRESEGSMAVADCRVVDEAGETLALLEGYVCTLHAGLETAFRAAGGGR